MRCSFGFEVVPIRVYNGNFCPWSVAFVGCELQYSMPLVRRSSRSYTICAIIQGPGCERKSKLVELVRDKGKRWIEAPARNRQGHFSSSVQWALSQWEDMHGKVQGVQSKMESSFGPTGVIPEEPPNISAEAPEDIGPLVSSRETAP
jgi:hypothetical protein